MDFSEASRKYDKWIHKNAKKGTYYCFIEGALACFDGSEMKQPRLFDADLDRGDRGEVVSVDVAELISDVECSMLALQDKLVGLAMTLTEEG